jgi:hypothetical protein
MGVTGPVALDKLRAWLKELPGGDEGVRACSTATAFFMDRVVNVGDFGSGKKRWATATG